MLPIFGPCGAVIAGDVRAVVMPRGEDSPVRRRAGAPYLPQAVKKEEDFFCRDTIRCVSGYRVLELAAMY